MLSIIRFFVESLKGMGYEMVNCIGLCRNSEVESSFVGSMGQTLRLM